MAIQKIFFGKQFQICKIPFFYCRSLRSTSGSSEDLRSETTTKPDAISLDLAASVIEDDPFEDQEGHAGQPQYSEAEGYFFILANILQSEMQFFI